MGNQNTGILGNIIGENLPYTKGNPFVVEVGWDSIFRLAGAVIVLILFTIAVQAVAKKAVK